MGAVVQFNYQNWLARYPEFTEVDIDTARLYFTEATLYCRNDGGGPITDASSQTLFLNMLVAHIAQLNAALNGEAATETVGRITNAAKGSVSVALEMDVPPGSAQWFNQTKYGAAYWAATAPYRTMRYVPGHTRVFDSMAGVRVR